MQSEIWRETIQREDIYIKREREKYGENVFKEKCI
jgi:hypothetical protein